MTSTAVLWQIITALLQQAELCNALVNTQINEAACLASYINICYICIYMQAKEWRKTLVTADCTQGKGELSSRLIR